MAGENYYDWNYSPEDDEHDFKFILVKQLNGIANELREANKLKRAEIIERALYQGRTTEYIDELKKIIREKTT